ncbi:hypothetical protein BJV78DRAFT_324558 [Lactifluus subvellereus]|nr:hypothetical protein BJV78DRAFT_324558 [Lactifluus subvellereus]
MAYQDSVQSFVRALRAPTDPPRPGDPQKIDIASEAWYATSFYVPRKAEVILEWCMTRLLKDGTRYPASNPASDLRYWKLLQGILLSVRSKGSKTGSGSNTWLLPLLNRVPLLPIVLSMLSSSLDLPVQKRNELYFHSSKSLALVWSLAAPKFSPDNLLECFGAMLRVLNEETVGSDESTGLIEICMLVTSSLHTALSNSSNKKKLSQAFMTSHIGVWLSFTSKERATYSAIRTEICDVGVELLFNVDSLKQIAESTRAKPLFEALQTHISSSSPHLLSNLPFLMTAFTNAIKKRRSLFSSGDSPIADAHSLAMLFFSSCEEILRGVGTLHGTQVWQSRLDLLKVVEDESLLSPRSEDTAVLLKEEVGSCVECLTSADDENVQIAVQCLCVLSRIDHDLLEAVTSRILSKFLTVLQPPREEYPVTPAHEFLFLALSYHSKTRTLPVHISRLVDSCALPSPYLSSLSIRTSYDGLVASPALTTSHLDRLSKAVRTFITPGQTLDTARRVIDMLRDIWERFHDVEKASAADYERGARKKRRTSISESTRKAREEDADAPAVSFVLATRIVAVVLSSLPLHTVTEAEQAKVQAIVTESFDGFVREAIRASTDAAISGSSDRRRDVWAAQVVGAAALRLLYTLQMSVPARHLPSDQNDLGDLAAAVLKVDGTLPEYGVEIFRYLIHHESHPPNVQRQQDLFDAVLTFLEVHLPAVRSAPQAWLGRSSQLSSDETGSAFAAVALLRLLLDRNLQIVNAYASSAQQERLLNLLHLADVELGYEDAQRGLSLVATVHECLHSANFWEQENIRSSLFVVQHARTSFLDTVDVAKPKKNAKKRASPHSESQICEAVKAYTFLLYAPTECFPKTSRNDFLRRAVVLDFLLGSMTSASTHRALQVVRTFLAKTFSFLGSWGHEASGRYLHHLMTSPLPVSAEQVTRELVHGHLVASFRAAVRGSTEALLDAIKICREQPLGSWLLLKDSDIPLRSSTQQLMDIAMADTSVSSFPPGLAGQLSTLFEHVFDQLHPLLQCLASHNVTERDEIMSYSDILLLWSRVITFGKYLGHPKNPSPGLGTQIAQAFGSAMHAVLVSELQLFSREEDRESHLQHIVTHVCLHAPINILSAL